MLKILGGVAAALIVVVVGLVGYAASKPDTFRVSRSITVQAPPEKIAAQVNDFHAWKAWSPFEARDPELKRTFSGPPSGVGSVYAYEGNAKVGSGRMEILELTPQATLVDLQFLKPMESHNTATFHYEPQGEWTRVTWQMDGPMTLVSKIMDVVFNMDRMVGPDFETGLANLKRLAEA